MIKAGVIDVTGYAGVELVHLPLARPQTELVAISSVSFTRQALSEVYPAYLGRCDMICTDQEEVIEKSDMIFAALSHGLSQGLTQQCHDKGRAFIDLGADFRLEGETEYTEWYGGGFLSKELHSEAAYNLPELFCENIKGKRLAANPGCYTTAVPLTLAPAVKNGLVELSGIIANYKSSVTDAGRKPTQNTHYSELNEGFFAYKVANHHHTPEVEQTLSYVTGEKIHLTSAPHLLPINRDILTTCYASLRPGVTQEQFHEAYGEAYANEPFLRLLLKGMSVDIKNTRYSSFCDVPLFTNPRCGQLVAISAIDNMIRGATRQVVRSMNLIFSLEETAGLLMIPPTF